MLVLPELRFSYFEIEHTISSKQALEVFEKIKFLQHYYPDFYDWYFKVFISGLLKGERKIILAMTNHKICGLILLKKNTHEKKVCTLYVDDYARGFKVGEVLLGMGMSYFERDYELTGYIPMLTVPEEKNLFFKKIFEKQGFVVVQRVSGMYRKDRDELIYKLS